MLNQILHIKLSFSQIWFSQSVMNTSMNFHIFTLPYIYLFPHCASLLFFGWDHNPTKMKFENFLLHNAPEITQFQKVSKDTASIFQYFSCCLQFSCAEPNQNWSYRCCVSIKSLLFLIPLWHGSPKNKSTH